MNSAYAGWASRWRVPLGFLLAVAYVLSVWFRPPTFRLVIAGGALAALGVALRAYAAGYLAKNQKLATEGPYAWTRNPLYLGSTLIGAGLALAAGNWLLGLVCVLLFGAIYWPVIRREEEYLRREFGEAYTHYSEAVPLYFPRFRHGQGNQKFQWSQYRRNHEYEALIGYVVMMIFLAFRVWLR